MVKLKPIEQLADDVKVGDLVRLKIKKGDNDYIGYCSKYEKYEDLTDDRKEMQIIQVYSFLPVSKRIRNTDFNNAERQLYLESSKKKVILDADEGLRVIAYEVLRRAKKK